MHRKPHLIERLFDDPDRDQGSLIRRLAGIVAVGEGFDDKRQRAPRQIQDDQSAISVLHVRGLRL